MALGDALRLRRSIRSYTSDALSLDDLSQLLWAAQGITHPEGRRTVPSAGATYPYELYVAADRVEGLDPGLYHYVVGDHRLDLVTAGALGPALADLSAGQRWMAQAPVFLVLLADLSRTAVRYGDRGECYVWLEGGGIVMAVSLQAVSLGLATVCVGAFDDDRLQAIIGGDLLPVAILPVGRPNR